MVLDFFFFFFNQIGYILYLTYILIISHSQVSISIILGVPTTTATLVVIENAFGIMAARMRTLVRLIECTPEKAKDILKACLAFHNYLSSTDETHEPKRKISVSRFWGHSPPFWQLPTWRVEVGCGQGTTILKSQADSPVPGRHSLQAKQETSSGMSSPLRMCAKRHG